VIAIWITAADVQKERKVTVMKERSSNCPLKAARASQLRLAINYEQQGKINDALATYLAIIARYPDSEERRVAEERLLRLTRAFLEEKGKIHPATLVYEHLEGVF